MDFRCRRKDLESSKFEFMSNKVRCVALLLLLFAGHASAQGLDTIGTRAAALGAFVAVADDASAVAWNPSGLVSGPIFNLQLGLGRSTKSPTGPITLDAAAGRTGTILLALGTTPVGLTYYRLTSTSVAADPAAPSTLDRQDRQVRVRTLVTTHVGATVQQSVGDFVTLGATVKLVRGSVGVTSLRALTWDDAADHADGMPRSGSTRGDIDMGAMVSRGRMRVGVVMRNVTAPAFEQEGGAERARLDRHARVGVAWGNRWPGLSSTVVAVDADITRVAEPSGDRRDVAAGVERWLRDRRVGVRGGVRASTVNDARVVVSGGGSYALRAGMYVDVFAAGGARHERAWGVAARVTY
jgi:hypothetical protein